MASAGSPAFVFDQVNDFADQPATGVARVGRRLQRHRRALGECAASLGPGGTGPCPALASAPLPALGGSRGCSLRLRPATDLALDQSLAVNRTRAPSRGRSRSMSSRMCPLRMCSSRLDRPMQSSRVTALTH